MIKRLCITQGSFPMRSPLQGPSDPASESSVPDAVEGAVRAIERKDTTQLEAWCFCGASYEGIKRYIGIPGNNYT